MRFSAKVIKKPKIKQKMYNYGIAKVLYIRPLIGKYIILYVHIQLYLYEGSLTMCVISAGVKVVGH